jgi:hypothetical protein
VDTEAARSISAHDSGRLGAIVMRVEDGAAVVAVSDPSNAAALAELETMLDGSARFAVAAPSRVAEALARVFSDGGERAESPWSAEASVMQDSAAPDELAAPVEDTSVLQDYGIDTADAFPEPAAPLAEQPLEWPPAPEVVFEPPPAPDVVFEPPPAPDMVFEPLQEATEEVATSFVADSAAPVEVQSDGAHVFDEPQEHEAEPAEEAEEPADDFSWAFAAVSEPVSTEVGSHEAPAWPEAFAVHEPVLAPPAADLNGHVGDEAEAAFSVVLRIGNGDAVELGSFSDRAGASAKAAALVEQLIADEPSGWTEIDGSYFRPQAIIAVDVVPAAG